MNAQAMQPLPGVAGRVSIVLPAWNSAGTVGSAVESCLAQTYRDVELIVVNDGSTDDTPRILASFGDRIRLIHRKNGGVAAARNTGLRAATGEFVAWMDNDDLMHPERVRLGAEVMKLHPDVVAVCSDFSAFVSPDVEIERSHIASYYGAVRRFGGMAAILRERSALPDAGLPAPVSVLAGQAYETLLLGNFVHPPTMLVRRRAMVEAGFLEETLRIGSEYEQTIRIARLGRIAYLEMPLLRYRRSDSQLSSETTSNGREWLEMLWILDKVRREDPAVFERRRRQLRQKKAASCLGAATGIGPSNRARALGLLGRALAHGARPVPVLRALAKILVPRSVVAAVKGRNSGLTDSARKILVLVVAQPWEWSSGVFEVICLATL